MTWQPPETVLHFNQNPYKNWLIDASSLTKKLQEASSGDFSVNRLCQYIGKPKIEESACLALPAEQYALIREVALLCKGEPWVYARSILPLKSLTGPLRFLHKLKDDSLGAHLFKHPSLIRYGLEITQTSLTCFLESEINALPSSSLSARRSVFSIHKKEILVAEVFLPVCLSHNVT